jgi:hypothetical protein
MQSMSRKALLISIDNVYQEHEEMRNFVITKFARKLSRKGGGSEEESNRYAREIIMKF